VSYLAVNGMLGEGLEGQQIGYSFVYHIEIALLFATLIAIGPLVRRPSVEGRNQCSPGFGFGEIASHPLSLPR
jgi:BCD family chlorophyll transporter-like MFS transporter